MRPPQKTGEWERSEQVKEMRRLSFNEAPAKNGGMEAMIELLLGNEEMLQ